MFHTVLLQFPSFHHRMICLQNNHTDTHQILQLFFPAHGDPYPVLGNMLLHGGTRMSGMYMDDAIKWMKLLQKTKRVTQEATIWTSAIKLKPYSSQNLRPDNKLMAAVQDISKSKTNFIVLFLAWSEPNHGAHANVVIIDTYSKTVERFEPHGRHENARTMDLNFIEFLRVNEMGRFKYIRPDDICMNGWGPQRLECSVPLPPIRSNPGYCGLWSIIYAHCRMQAPDRLSRSIHTDMCKIDKHLLLRQVTSYAVMLQIVMPGIQRNLEITDDERKSAFDKAIPPYRPNRAGLRQWLRQFMR